MCEENNSRYSIVYFESREILNSLYNRLDYQHQCFDSSTNIDYVPSTNLRNVITDISYECNDLKIKRRHFLLL